MVKLSIISSSLRVIVEVIGRDLQLMDRCLMGQLLLYLAMKVISYLEDQTTRLNGLWHLPEVTCTGNKDIAIFISTHKTLVRTISINFSITLLLLSVSHFCYYWCFVS